MHRHHILISALLILALIVPIHANGQDNILALKEKIIEIQNQGNLGFRNFTICSNIIGYGQYVEMATPQIKTGGDLLIYYEPVNLFTNRRAGSYHLWYTQDMILLAEDGKELYNGREILNFNYQTTSPVLDTYATNSLSLGKLPPGKYVFKAVMHDKLKKTNAEYVQNFEIVE